ncbi:hypothetical protein, partial [Pseudomonas sp. FG-3G]
WCGWGGRSARSRRIRRGAAFCRRKFSPSRDY